MVAYVASVLGAVLVLSIVASAAQADEPKVILKTIGKDGTGPGEFTGVGQSVQAIALNTTGAGGVSPGDFYVLDSGNRRVQQFSKSGVFIRMFGKRVNKTKVQLREAQEAKLEPVTVTKAEENVCTATSGDVCQAGAVDSGEAGTVASTLGGIAIDQGTGVLYVPHPTQKRVDVFSATGSFQGAFGWKVNAAAPEEKLQYCISSCQIGTPGTKGGQFNTSNTTPRGVAVNPTTGNVMVADSGNLRLQEFDPTVVAGEVIGVSLSRVIGWDVVASGPSNANQIENVIVAATGGTFKITFNGQTTSDLAYDADAEAVEAALEALPNIGAGNVEVVGGPGDATGSSAYGITFVGTLAGLGNGPLVAESGALPLAGTVTVPAPMNPGNTAQFEICKPTLGDECKAGTAGAGSGQISGGAPNAGGNLPQLAFDATGALYLLSASESACNETEKICRIQKFSPAGTFAQVFANELTSKATNARAQSIAVDQQTGHVFVGWHPATPITKYLIKEYDSAGQLVATHPKNENEELKTNNAVAGPIAVGSEELLYFGSVQNKQIYILGPVPPPAVDDVTCEEPTGSSVICTAVVTVPTTDAGPVQTFYSFEYSANGVNWNKVVPPGGEKSLSSGGPNAVEEKIGPLEPGTVYQIRVCAQTSKQVCSTPAVVSTPSSAPVIVGQFVEEVTASEATLSARVNPRNQASSYWFEWGTTATYGQKVPGKARQIGSGSSAVLVQDQIQGLLPETTYHYRLVAENASGTVYGPDQKFETLNSCGLTQQRCFELVSPPDKGPAGEAGGSVALAQDLQFQVDPDGDGVAYDFAYGPPDATAGGEIVYTAQRSSDGWLSAQLSPPALEPTLIDGPSGVNSRYLFLSDDLTCGVVTSAQPLTGDAAATKVVETGGMNLYRRNPDGSHSLVTNRPPTNDLKSEPAFEYVVIGASQDCSRIIFETDYKYPGIDFSSLYEWDDGDLRNAGVVPGASTPVEVQAGAGASFWNAASDDATRIVFTALSQEGADAGNPAVFVWEDGTSTDVSQSQGPAASQGATFQTASDVGEDQVFFTANYGLTPVSSTGQASCVESTGAGCDLYRYSVDSGVLTNLSAASGPDSPNGAGVVGVLDASQDGSHVYFAAQGQLVPDAGNTYAQNVAGGGAYNIYLSYNGTLEFVAAVSRADLTTAPNVGLLVASKGDFNRARFWSSRATPSGKHLLFQSRSTVTDYPGGVAPQAYLYSAGSGQTVCVSCRRDGLPSVGGAGAVTLPTLTSNSSPWNPPRVISADGSRVFFASTDALAKGALEGVNNLYEWHEGQISLLVSDLPGVKVEQRIKLAGASADGSSVFFRTKRSLVPQDTDQRQDVYAARVGGGFAPSPPPSKPCDPLVESACQGVPPSNGVDASVAPASGTFVGPGNPPASEARKKKHKGKKGKTKGKKGQGKKRGKGKGRKGSKRHSSKAGRAVK